MKLAVFTTLVATGALVAGASLGGTYEVENTSFTTPDGMRVLQHEIVVNAPRDKVWEAFTTSEGWISWAAPVAFVDFRRGGLIETSYNPAAQPGDQANIKSEILSYLPQEMLSIRAVQTPPQFPHKELVEQLWSVFLFEDEGEGKTRIISSGAGYRDGEGYDVIYDMFEQANAMMLEQLDRRLRQGPVDWSKDSAAAAAHREAGAITEEDE